MRMVSKQHKRMTYEYVHLARIAKQGAEQVY